MLKNVLDFFKKGGSTKRSVAFSMLYNFVWGIIKIIIGVFYDWFFLLSGVSTILIGFTKTIFVLSYRKRGKLNLQVQCVTMSVLILLVSTTYMVYSGCLLLAPGHTGKNLILSITIALFSFVELITSLKNVISSAKSKDVMLLTLRGSSLVTSLFAILQTQVALLSATNVANSSFYNACCGIVMGLLGFVVATILLLINSNSKNFLPGSNTSTNWHTEDPLPGGSI